MKMRKWFIMGAMAALAGLASAAYTGSLSSPGGLTVGGNWASGVATMEWAVDQVGSLWSYEYTLAVSKAPDISHIIIEVSDIRINIYDDVDFDVDIYSTNGNPGIPGSLTGVKYDDIGDVRSYTISFLSDRIPVWGDFYAKGGSNSYVYNTGFLAADPTDPASNGSINNHILRPDSVIIVPAPAAILLAAMGTGLVGYLRRREKI